MKKATSGGQDANVKAALASKEFAKLDKLPAKNTELSPVLDTTKGKGMVRRGYNLAKGA